MTEEALALWQQFGGRIVGYGLSFLGAIIVLVLGRIAASIISRIVRSVMQRSKVDVTITQFVSRLVSSIVMVVAVVAALDKFGVQTTSFVALLGAAGLAVGLALQGSLSNFASGVMILLFRPFSVGDFIDAGGVKGTVKEIRIFTTVLATLDNVKVIAPNSALFSGVIHNYSVFETRRIDITVGISYGDDIGRAVEVATQAMKADSRIKDDPEPQVFVTDLGDSSVNLVARCWTARTDFWNAKCDLTRSIKENFDLQGIEIPFPQRVVHQAPSEASAAN